LRCHPADTHSSEKVKLSTLDQIEQGEIPPQRSPHTDKTFLIFLLANVLISIPFLPYFSTSPLFYHDAHHMTEFEIGLILGFNGLLIFLMAMPLMKSS